MHHKHTDLLLSHSMQISSDPPLNILIIGHDAGMTGAPLLLLSYLQAAIPRMAPNTRFRTILGGGGPLVSEFTALADTLVISDIADSTGLHHRIKRRLIRFVSQGAEVFGCIARWLRSAPSPDVIYVNTVASVPTLQLILPFLRVSPRIVIHVHELESTLMRFERQANVYAALASADCIIAPSLSVCKALASISGVNHSKITVVNEWICRDIPVKTYAASRHAVRKSLGLADSAILCLGVGYMQWRKGSDLLPLLAHSIASLSSSIHVLWVGNHSPDDSVQCQLDTEKLGCGHNLTLAPQTDDPYPYYAAADIFILPSREDPYPVAMLEAALFSLPVVCFDGSGGAPEFVSSGSGFAVPFLDLRSFADHVYRLAIDRSLRHEMGAIGREFVLSNHLISHCEPLISSLLCSDATCSA
jgi:glycosyltransferase involved in cell wall biosynthesis